MRELLACATLAAGTCLWAAACTPARYRSEGAISFDTAAVWVVRGADSSRLAVEVADSRRKQEVGLSGRSSLAPDAGMLFVFDVERSGEDGFWMVGTRMPLDIAFMDDGGVIKKLLQMDVCEEADGVDACPGYFPGVPYRSALEVNRGWFAKRGLGVGAHVRIAG